jgi:polyferredoxin/NAD-dependent dihydropyrimidine dehydrogenase PreA subunit
MRIVTVRRISQVFFLLLFTWFCVVSTSGTDWWRLRGWPVNLFLQLDPLVALGTVLTTGKLYAGLLWALPVLVLTILVGRFFCGWLCPFGTMHQAVGWLAHRNKPTARRLELNSYRRGGAVKYYILLVFLGMGAFPVLGRSLLTGLLDPIPLVTRSVNLMLLPIMDSADKFISVTQRYYTEAALILVVFFVALAMNLLIPRFYCRFICPTGALLGIIDRFALLRIGKTHAHCADCLRCERACEGACHPAGNFRISECVLCMNCLHDCKHELITYGPARSAGGEFDTPDISRRGFVLSVAGGAVALPAIRLANSVGANYDPLLIRPPGSLPEQQFLERCLKCGQCMRVCPTNVMQPAGLQHGIEALWTPTMNNRIGSSGCQYNCTACSHICPTAAIRPLKMDEKHGEGAFADKGPVKIGTAFVDRGRCLPWAMGKPCIVCQENCPVSPKAIYTTEEYETIRDGTKTIASADGDSITFSSSSLTAKALATGDYYLVIPSVDGLPYKIIDNTASAVKAAQAWRDKPAPGQAALVQVRLQKPWVDIDQCIGCGICEHECPVSGQRAIRVSAEGESRNKRSRLGLR